MFGNLRPGDKLVSVVGAPYDTMQEAIGTLGDEDTKEDSLIAHGVLYDEVPLKNNDIDLDAIREKIDSSVKWCLFSVQKAIRRENPFQ